ncbi:ATP-dependent Clp protease proteolytic subunit [uncultured Draconibacterium sp.]|uniref:ATP-dependent Clp protease proteolytic subunit n=1 Tax=uncultured Draconibacterium sp. TaxID=1573823 RepID=UPI00321748CC
MDLKFSKIVNREKRTAEMLLYGVFGTEINGHYFAQELNWLSRDFDEITIRINSDGGSVSHGLSIVSAMMNSQAVIVAHVDGIAASMAAVVLAAADRVTINDYAKVMIHSPYYAAESGQKVKQLSAKDRKALKMLKSTLVELLTKRNIEEAEINKLMLTDSWFTSDEAKEAKLVDEVIKTGRKTELAELEPLTLVARINTENSHQNLKTMKKVFAKLGLSDDATEEQVVEAINKLETTEAGTDNAVLVDKLIAVAKKTGRVTDKNEAKVKALAETDMELFCDFIGVENMGENAGDNEERLSELVAKALKEGGGKKPEVKNGHDWDWYQKNEPEALAAMEVKEPEKFKNLLAEYEKTV